MTPEQFKEHVKPITAELTEKIIVQIAEALNKGETKLQVNVENIDNLILNKVEFILRERVKESGWKLSTSNHIHDGIIKIELTADRDYSR